MKEHEINIIGDWFDAIERGDCRTLFVPTDRFAQSGDTLKIRRLHGHSGMGGCVFTRKDPAGGETTKKAGEARTIHVLVTFVMTGWAGIENRTSVLSVSRLPDEDAMAETPEEPDPLLAQSDNEDERAAVAFYCANPSAALRDFARRMGLVRIDGRRGVGPGAVSGGYRVGRIVPRHVYRGDQPLFTAASTAEALNLVRILNLGHVAESAG